MKKSITIAFVSNGSPTIAIDACKKTTFTTRFILRVGPLGCYEIYDDMNLIVVAIFSHAANAAGELIKYLKTQYEKVTIEL